MTEELIKEFNESLKTIKKTKEKAGEQEFKRYIEVISDLEFALEWMQTAKRPDN